MDANTITSTTTVADLRSQADALYEQAESLYRQAAEQERQEAIAAQATVIGDVAADLGANPETVARFLQAMGEVAFVPRDRLVHLLVSARARMSASNGE